MAGSTAPQPQFIESTGNRVFWNAPLIESVENDQIVVPERKSWKNLFAYMGPGFLVSIAYIDPGNFETDLQSGARYKYGLLWIILLASCSALVIQSLAANLGVVTGKHLAEHCRNEYPKWPNTILWVLAEIAIIACDIPEVIGTAFALNMLFNLPVWSGVIVTGLSTLVLLALQQYGVRKLELLIALLVFTIAACFMVELGNVKPSASEVLNGLFVPQLKGDGATGLAISLLGAMVMPHNLFLHSALVLSRKIPRRSFDHLLVIRTVVWAVTNFSHPATKDFERWVSVASSSTARSTPGELKADPPKPPPPSGCGGRYLLSQEWEDCWKHDLC